MAKKEISEKEFRSIANWQKKKSEKIAFAKRSPESLLPLMHKIIETVERQHKKHDRISDAWEEVLPAAFKSHCKIKEFKNGILKIKVDSPSWKYNLQMSADMLIKQLNEAGGRAKVKSIKIEI